MRDYSDYTTITATRRDCLLTLTLNRPESVNATDAAMHEKLARLFYDVAEDDDTDVVILTGAGKAFCAGGDTRWMQSMIDEPEAWRKTVREGKRLIFGLLDLDKPVIAKLNGHAVGMRHGKTMGAIIGELARTVAPIAHFNARFSLPCIDKLVCYFLYKWNHQRGVKCRI